MVFGGTPFGQDEFGYGPARYLTADEVAALATLVETITVEDFAARIDLGLLSRLDVYPSIWDRTDDEVDVYLRDGYEALRTAFLSAREAGDAMIVALV